MTHQPFQSTAHQATRSNVNPGTVLLSDGRRYQAGRWIGLRYVKATDLATGRETTLKLGEFTIAPVVS